MNHDEMYVLVSAFIDNELSDDDRSVVVDHLKTCVDCNQRINHLVALKHNVHSTGNVELPYAFASTLTRSIHHNEEVTVSWLGIERYALKYVFGLVALVVLLIAVTSYRQDSDPLPVERYISGISSDSADSHILTKQGAITRDDVMFAAFTK
jgi:anti-sigma factor RsiW